MLSRINVFDFQRDLRASYKNKTAVKKCPSFACEAKPKAASLLSLYCFLQAMLQRCSVDIGGFDLEKRKRKQKHSKDKAMKQRDNHASTRLFLNLPWGWAFFSCCFITPRKPSHTDFSTALHSLSPKFSKIVSNNSISYA